MSPKNQVHSIDQAYRPDDDIHVFKQDPIVVQPGGGDRFRIAGGEYVHRVKSADTNGAFSVIEIISPPEGGALLHVHENEDELVYVLSGEIEVTVGCQTMLAVPGVIALMPRGTAHGFTNVGDTPSVVIDTILPGAFDNYFTEMATLYQKAEPSQKEIDRLSEKYGIRYL